MRRNGVLLLLGLPGLLGLLAFASGCNDDDPAAPPAELGPIVLSVEFPQAIMAGTAGTLRVRAGHEVEGATVWASGIDISLDVAGGLASSLTGTTDADGWYQSSISAVVLAALDKADVVPDSIFVDITADDAESDPVAESAKAPILEPGLLAAYSNGANVLEGPVFNGWWADCAAPDRFIYQGECGAGASPVSWPLGSFSAEWNGYLYTGAGGTIYFNSHYWVDGIVYIEVNGAVVANLNTTGGGYGANVTLPAQSWVPVNMTFAGNGGSNNMHLGWPAANALGWEAVPRAALGTPRALLAGVASR
jgi:hypothetical protein